MPMQLEIVAVGTELLLGDTIDTNSPGIARALATIGARVVRGTTTGDSRADIIAAVDGALKRTGWVIVTGGLGPTSDDITREAVAGLLDAKLHFDQVIWKELTERLARVGRTIGDSNKSQAMIPEGGEVLHNRLGSAPGLWIESDRGVVILLPGVPVEVEVLITEQVIPRLESLVESSRISSRILRTSGISESRLGELIGPLEAELAPVTLAYLPEQAGVDLRLTAWQVDDGTAATQLDAAEHRVRDLAGEWIYTVGEMDLADVIVSEASGRGLKIATAESCTGGMLATRLTAIPGSSAVFDGGVIAYSNEQKTALLGVGQQLILEHGAVSGAVAEAMALGATVKVGAQYGVGITGIAGPSGGTEDKPVGSVWVAWAKPGGCTSRRFQLVGDRHQIRLRATQAALFGLWQQLLVDSDAV